VAVVTLAAGPIGALAQPATPTPAPLSGERLFVQQCAACHSLVPGETRVGPSLRDVVGKAAGTTAGFAYSEALAKSGILWEAQQLDRWLSDSNVAVPGSAMNFRQADAAKRQAIIAYLATQKTQ
jgi:cytochrome c